MTNFNTAMSCAILMVNDEHRKDYYDNFVPLIAECIRVSPAEVISANQVQDDLVSSFGIYLPLSVITTILKRKLLRAGLVKSADRKYIPVRDDLERSTFRDIQFTILEHHEKLINDLIEYVEKKHQEHWEKDETELNLDSFLKEHNLVNMEKKIVISSPIRKHYMIADYINNLDKDSIMFTYLESIIKGNMLADAIYYTEPSHINMKFKTTEIYFDTSFIIYALGYAGDTNQAPCLELLDIIRDSGGIARCFRHTILEMTGILDGYRYRLSQGQLMSDNHGTFEHFMRMGYSPADIERIIYGLENEVEKKLKIRVVDKPPYDGHYRVHNIDEAALAEKLEKNYKKRAALIRDVDSVAAVMRLRKSFSTMYVENCKALFITTNTTLAEETRTFFNNGQNSRIIPPVLPVSTITNILWLKNPTKVPNLARKRIIADCFATVRPQEHLWKRYIEKAEALFKEGQITEEEYYTLRSAPEARIALMEYSYGEAEVITLGSIEQILHRTKEAMVSDVVHDFETKIFQKEKEIQTSKEQIEAAKIETTQYKNEAAVAVTQQTIYFDAKARRKSRITVIAIKAFIVLLLLGGQSYSFFMLNYAHPRWLQMLIFLVFVLYFPISGSFGLSLNKPFIRLEQMLYKYFRRKIEKDFMSARLK